MEPTQNLYNARLKKMGWFVRRFGVGELVRKPLRVLLAPLILSLLRRRTFVFEGQELNYFYHAYNMTWATERCIEIPIGLHYVKGVDRREILEVGNVLSHYLPVQHEVLDKFEQGPGIINEDVVTFAPHRKYSLILSISTFEHIGYDDDLAGKSGEKILKAIRACQELLQRTGRLIVTVPIGYNKELDQLISDTRWQSSREFFFKRAGPRDWEPIDKENALTAKYGKPYPYANAIMVAEFGSIR